MARSVRVAALVAGAVLLFLCVAVRPIRSDSVHDLLPQYGLPTGLLPDVVKSYTLSDDGTFEVQLASTCYVQFTDLVYYDTTIQGNLSYGQISDLSGIHEKKLFVWLSVTGIVAHPDDDSVEFQVGFTSEYLPESQFQSIPRCKSSVACRGAPAILSQANLVSDS